jgi:ankyrin repeat protein
MNTLLMHSIGGKRIWLETASQITGYSAKDHHIDVNCHDFHERLKLLICPWLVTPQPLPLTVEPLMDHENMRITLADENSIALWSRDEDSDDFRLLDIEKARPENTQWMFSGNPDELPQPITPPKKTFQAIMQPIQLQILTNQQECRYYYQDIHRGAIAIIEIAAWDMEQRNGIYFFDRKQGRITRMLRHVLIGVSPAPTSMIIRPMEMWMLTEERVIYFGPTGNAFPLTAAGRMDWPLWLAGNGKVKEAIRVLKELGVSDINTPSITGDMTLLHIATLHNQANAVRMLIKAQANPEARDDQGMTCVMIAASVDNAAMVRLLCTEGKALPNATTHFDETALHAVGHQGGSKHSKTKETVQALLDCRADPNAVDTKGQTPLFSYSILDNPSAVRLLCAHGADPMHRNHTGMTPLHALFEVSNERRSAVILAQRFNADVNSKDNRGMTPLMLAAQTRTYVNVRVLLDDLKANPLLLDNRGHDALWFARNGTDAPAQARAVIRMIEAKCAEWRE